VAALSRLGVQRRRLAVLLAVAAGSAGIGIWAGQGIESPQDAARRASAPAASPITVPVERKVIATSIVVRGDVQYSEEYVVTPDPDVGEGGNTSPVVTGRLPRSGSTLKEGTVALEISGRPILALQGRLPMYRALRPGNEGADVKQLQAALRRLGHLHGAATGTYDAATVAAVRRFYEAAGYDPVPAAPEDQQQLEAANQRLTEAHGQTVSAKAALAAGRTGPPQSQLLAAQGAVDTARRARDLARSERDAARRSGVGGLALARLDAALADAENALAVARAELKELKAGGNTGSLRQAVTTATKAEQEARRARDKVRAATGPRVPRGEIVFVPSLPRRVQKVEAKLGAVPGGGALSLTATTARIDTSVSEEERQALTLGAEVRVDDPTSDIKFTGTVTRIADEAGTDGALAGAYYVRIDPQDVDPKRIEGLNLRVTMPIESTDGEVLAVPVAALVTDAAGTTKVRVQRGGADVDVAVVAGLAADGFAEVTAAAGGELAEGDLVVVGQQW
jgi:peptidoglycan hydrolase-like protein with peptidoglycan-binding domain